MRLSDGTILPSYLQPRSVGRAQDSGIMSNLGFRTGEVKKIVFATDPSSVSKKWIEYSVEVQHKDGTSPGTVTTYPNCTVLNLFGGLADKSSFTLRADTKAQTTGTDTKTGLGNGSKVLLLCINGETPNAVIIGGIRNAGDNVDSQSDGHNYSWMFNGFSANVNNDGELVVEFNGATNNDGSPRSDIISGAPGSMATFSKDGSVTIKQGQQQIIIDTPNQKVQVSSNGYTVTIDGSGTKLGDIDARDAIILGTTFRTAMTVMHTSMVTALSLLSGLVAGAGTAIGTAGAAIITAGTLNAIPFIGGILAVAPFIAAGTALTTAGGLIASMTGPIEVISTAITTFESELYLSLQNFTS